MGGTVSGKGNAEFNCEFNFLIDPEAAHKVFKSFKSIHLIPWEASPEFVFPKESYETLKNINTTKSKFFLNTHSHQFGRLNKYMICDGFTPMVVVDPSIAGEITELEAKVFTQGEAAGQISYAWPVYTAKYNKN